MDAAVFLEEEKLLRPRVFPWPQNPKITPFLFWWEIYGQKKKKEMYKILTS